MTESVVNIETAYKLGLSKDEFEEIKKILGRDPKLAEITAYSFIWTESFADNNGFNVHELAKKARRLLDNSKITNHETIDIGNDLACVMKIESNNYHVPNESYDESASCTINLHRDLLTLGAKPVSGINSFHFGTLQPENKNHLKQFITGSSNYSNAFGAPVVGLQAYFDECNINSPILNSLLIGLINKNKLSALAPIKSGDKILIISAEKESKLNSPIYEKILHESMEEALKNSLIQGMYSFFNTSFLNSCVQIHAKTRLGMHIDLDNLSNGQQTDINNLLISNTIASIVMISDTNKVKELIHTFNDSGLTCINIGELTEKEQLKLSLGKNIIADLPIKTLVKRVKAAEELSLENSNLKKEIEFDINQIPLQKTLRDIAWFLVKHPNIASKKWIFEQYDNMVGVSNMTTNFPSSAALVNLKESNSALAISLESNARYIQANPEIGIQIAVSETARKIACTGAKPLAITAIFNFLNPNNPIGYSHFAAIVNGLAKVCKKFKIPVTGEKIKIYNTDNKENKPNTNCFMPVVGMIGLLEDKNHQMTISFKNKGNIIFLIGQSKEDISCSEYLYSYHGVKESPVPWFNLDQEFKVQAAAQELIKNNYVCSVHTVSKGGLFISLIESGIRFGLGFDIITDTDIRTDAFLFGESQGRILVSITPSKEDHFIDFMMKKEIPFLALGHVTKGEMRVDDISFGFIDDAKREYENTLEKLISL